MADSKLKAAYGHSRNAGRSKAYKGAVVFNIPHEDYDPDLVVSYTGKLCRLQPAAASPIATSDDEAPPPAVRVVSDEDGSESDQQLLRMKRVTDKEWLSASQDIKNKVSVMFVLMGGCKTALGAEEI